MWPLVVVFQCLSPVWLFGITWNVAHQAPLSSAISQSFLKFMCIEALMLFNHFILCHLIFLLPSVFLASGFFLMSQLFTSGGQSIGASVSASLLPMNIQDWFPVGLTGFISLKCKGPSRVFFSTIWKYQFFWLSLLHLSILTLHMTWINHNFEYLDLCWQSDVFCFALF